MKQRKDVYKPVFFRPDAGSSRNGRGVSGSKIGNNTDKITSFQQ